MMIREPAVAGTFYPAGRTECLDLLQDCLREAEQHAAARSAQAAEPVTEPRALLGGIVPHAGWMCSGAVAAEVFWEISRRVKPETIVVLFGAVHHRHGPKATIFTSGAWETPLGLARIGERLTERLLGQSGLLEGDPHAHDQEHSIEVQVPFIQHLLPHSTIVPIMVPPTERAAAVGTAVGRTCQAYGAEVVFIGSTDLTHYGPGYSFMPHGVGPKGLDWAKNVNDRRMIELILALREDVAVREAEDNQNACGAGAIAATIAACKARGATAASLLRHTTSHEVLSEIYDEPMQDAVGYAGITFEK